MEQGNNAGGFPVIPSDGHDGDLKLLFAIGREDLGDSRPRLVECSANWLEHVAVANDIEQRCPGGDRRLAVQFFESGITDRNAPGGIDHQQTVCQRGEDGPNFGSVFGDLAIEFALADEQLL